MEESKKKKMTPLHITALYENLSAIELLTKHDAGLNVVDRFGFTPLCLAFQHGNFSVLLTLIAAEAKIEKIRVNLEVLLFTAIENGNVKVVRRLFREGAYRLAVDETGKTANQRVRISNNHEIRKLLSDTDSLKHENSKLGSTGG